MPFDLDALKDALGEHYAPVRDHIAGLQSAADLSRREAERLRTELATARTNHDALKTERNAAFDKLGVTDFADLEAIKDTQGSAEQVAQLNAKLKRYEAEIRDRDSKLDAAQTSIRDLRRDGLLDKQLRKHEWAEGNADLVKAYFQPRIAAEGDDWIVRNEDGSTVTVEDAFTQFAAEHPGLLSSKGTPGGGTGKPATGGHQKPFAEMSITEKGELYRRSPQQYEALRQASEN